MPRSGGELQPGRFAARRPRAIARGTDRQSGRGGIRDQCRWLSSDGGLAANASRGGDVRDRRGSARAQTEDGRDKKKKLKSDETESVWLTCAHGPWSTHTGCQRQASGFRPQASGGCRPQGSGLAPSPEPSHPRGGAGRGGTGVTGRGAAGGTAGGVLNTFIAVAIIPATSVRLAGTTTVFVRLAM